MIGAALSGFIIGAAVGMAVAFVLVALGAYRLIYGPLVTKPHL